MLPANVQVLSAICVQLAPESPIPFLTEVHCWYDLDTSFRTAPEPIGDDTSKICKFLTPSEQYFAFCL